MIESKANETYKHLKRLKQSKYIKEFNEFLVFGEKLITEALKAGIVKSIITSNEFISHDILISAELMNDLVPKNMNFEMIALCEIKPQDKVLSKHILVLEDIQDPNNLGALIRSALAFNFNHIIMTDKCAKPYNDKVIRASSGSVFHANINIADDIYEEINSLKDQGYLVYTTDLRAEDKTHAPSSKSILVLGNEGQGISPKMRNLSDQTIKIKTNTVESLNVLVAGSILMYEWSK